MGVHNHQWYLQPGNGSQGTDAITFLETFGPITQVEVHVPTALADFLQQTTQPIPQPVIGWALIDTGATSTCVDSSVIQSLGVPPIGVAAVGTAGGPQQQPVFPAALRFTGMGNTHEEFASVLGCDLSGQPTPDGLPLLCLVGRDVLKNGLLVYNGMTGGWTLARNP